MRRQAIAAVALFIGLVWSVPAFSQTIVWVNWKEVMTKSKPGKRVAKQTQNLQNQFDAKVNQLQAPLIQERKRLEKERMQLEKQQREGSIAPQELNRRLKELQQKYVEYTKKVEALNKKMMKLHQEYTKKLKERVMNPFHKKLMKAVRQLQKKKGYSYILVYDPDSALPILYADPKLDVTKELIKILDRM